MIEIKRILCPIDFSDHSRRALDHAVAIAKWYDSAITLLHIYSAVPGAAYAPGAPMPSPIALTPLDQEALLASMKHFAESEVGAGIALDFETGEGSTAAGILARARAMPADLVVMGTHGRSGVERLMLGSVTEKVLRKATCPVLSVPRHATDVVPLPPVLFTRILCATDFSPSATHALNYAMSLAQEADAHLTVLHAIEVPEDLTPEMYQAVPDFEPTLASYLKAAREERVARLQTAVPGNVRAYCTVDTVLATGKPYREILRVAAEQHSDLIVLGIHGRSAADLLFVGSTTNHVVRQAACPVLTLRSG